VPGLENGKLGGGIGADLESGKISAESPHFIPTRAACLSETSPSTISTFQVRYRSALFRSDPERSERQSSQRRPPSRDAMTYDRSAHIHSISRVRECQSFVPRNESASRLVTDQTGSAEQSYQQQDAAQHQHPQRVHYRHAF